MAERVRVTHETTGDGDAGEQGLACWSKPPYAPPGIQGPAAQATR